VYYYLMMTRRLALILLIASASPARALQDSAPRLSTSFEVAVTDPESGSIHVALRVSQNVDDEVRVSIPAWAPGAYRIVKYAKAVKAVHAANGTGGELEVSPVDDQTWAVKTGRAGTFEVAYDLSVEKLRMDRDHCFIAGPDTYFYVVGHKEAPCRVVFRIPEGWKVGTALEKDGEAYRARDYDTFIDCPTELGTFELLEFSTDKTKYELVVHAKGPVDGPKFSGMCRSVVREQNRIFGRPPFDRYVFFFHLRDGTGGRGLEHLNSTDIVMPYLAIRSQPLVAASITSHEYFHLWNVKRIRPAELGPFDYTGIVRTKSLWLCEGVTSYYGDRALLRSGLWSEEVYLAHLAEQISTLQNNPDRQVTSVEEASKVVWDRKDWPRLDYYNKGELLGLLIDLRIRAATAGKRSLDDAMRLLYQRYVVGPSKEGKGPIGVGYPDDGIERALGEVSGESWKGFCDRYIRGVEELPYGPILGEAGLKVDLATVKIPDLGGADLRFTLVMFVPPGSEAEKAGLRATDRVAALNGVEVTRANIREELEKVAPGDEVKVKLLRTTGTVEVTVPARRHDRTTCRIRRTETPTELETRVLEGWLSRPADY
jgi:predicted metalloprotease with PDZ domain